MATDDWFGFQQDITVTGPRSVIEQIIEKKSAIPGNPKPIHDAELVDERGDEFRDPICPAQVACLNVAVKNKWPGFHCGDCKFSHGVKSPEDE